MLQLLVEMNSFFDINVSIFEKFVFSLVAILVTVLALLNKALPQDYGDLHYMARRNLERKHCFHS